MRKRLREVLERNGIYTPALLDELMAAVKQARTDEREAIWKLIEFFCAELSFKPPAPVTKADYKQLSVLWLKPLEEIKRQCDGASEKAIHKAIEYHKKNGLACAYPKQIVTMALTLRPKHSEQVTSNPYAQLEAMIHAEHG